MNKTNAQGRAAEINFFVVTLLAFIAIGAFSFSIPQAHASVNCGETSQSGTDSGNGGYAWATPCVTGSNSSGYTVSNIDYWVGTAASTNFTLGVYSDNSNTPHTLLCSVNTGTITPTANAWNSVNITGCGTLSASTQYWVGYLTQSDGVQQGLVSGNCLGTSENTPYDNGGDSTLPNPFGTSNFSGNCYSFYMVLNASGSSSAPTITSFSALPSTVSLNGTSMLSWNVSNASSVQIVATGFSFSTSTAAGSTTTPALSTSTFYTLTATNANGTSTATTTVMVTPPASTPAYPLAIGPNKTIVDQNGTPVYLVGDDAWSLATQVSDQDVDTYLAARAAEGYNVIWIAAADNIYQTNAPEDYYGNVPFDGPDFTNEDAAYWSHIDYVVEQAQNYGITVMLDPAFVGLNSADGYLASYESSTNATMTAYGSWLGTRYKNNPNIVWALGGDASLYAPAVYVRLNALAAGIQSTDTNHLMTLEPCPEGTCGFGNSTDYEDWTSGNTGTSTPATLNLDWVYEQPQSTGPGCASDYTASNTMPEFIGEDWYENEHSMTQVQLREEMYQGVLSGCAYGQIFGNDEIWTMGNTVWEEDPGLTWQSQLSSQGSLNEAYNGKLMESREFWKMVPDTANTIMTAGEGSGTTEAVDSLTSDGMTDIAYIPTQRTVTMDLTKLAGSSVNAWWFNPSTATSTEIGTYNTTGSQNFTSPDTNDWVLVLDNAAAGLPAPGTSVMVTYSGSTSTPPGISSFVAAPGIVAPAETSTISWNVSNASSVQIMATGFSFSTSTPSGSITVNPTSTTTYTLSAVNANGTSTATATVTVDGSTPSTPTNVAASAINASEIALSWASSTDSGGSGIAGYNIFRCTGASCTPTVKIGTSSGASYTDTTLSASTAYTYAVSAYNGAGTVSATSTTATATTATINSTITQTCTNSGYLATSLNCTFPNSVTPGDVVMVYNSGDLSFDGGIATVSGCGITWTNLKQDTSDAFVAAYGVMGSAGSCTPTISVTGQESYSTWAINAIDLTGVNGAVDASAYTLNTTPGSSSYTSPSITTANGGDLVIGLLSSLSSYFTGQSVAAPYAYQPLTQSNVTGYYVQPLPGATAATLNTPGSYSNQNSLLTVAFEAASSSGSGSGGAAPVINSFVAVPASMTIGSSSVLSWNTASSSLITIIGNNLNFSTSTASGTATVTPNVTGTIVYTLSASNVNGTSTATTSIVVSPGSVPAISAFSASPTVIASAGTSTLSWSVTNAASVAITPGSFSTSTLAGSMNVHPTSTITYTLTATNANGSAIATTTVTVDTTPPTVPANLAVTGVTTSSVSLSWASSTDSVGVAGYQIFRNGTQVGTTTALSFTDTNLAASTTYSYTVDAFDTLGNVSAQSSVVHGTTQALPQPPVIASFSANPASIIASQTSTLSWSVSNDTALSINNGVGNVFGLSSVTVAPATTTVYTLTATNANGTTTAQATVTVSPDTTPPSVPTNLATTSVTTSSISLSWTASTDNIGVAGYKIYRGGTQIGTSTAPSFTNTGLAASTTYSYTVAAYDAAGNTSAQSSALQVRTSQLPDTIPPTTSITSPANNATVSSTITVTATATDNVGVTKVLFFLDGVTVATDTATPYSWTWNTTGSANGAHTLMTAAYDAAGNVGTSTLINVTVSNSTTTTSTVKFVQQAANAAPSTATSFSVSFATSTAAGDVILVGFDKDGTQTPTVTDTQGNVFTEAGSELVSPGSSRTRLYYAKNIKGGADTVTISLSKSSSYIEVYLTEYSGANTSTPIDVQAGKSGSASAVTSGSATTTVASEVIYGLCIADAKCTAGSGFTSRSTLNSNLVEDRSVTSTGSYAATGSANSGWTMQMVGVRP